MSNKQLTNELLKTQEELTKVQKELATIKAEYDDFAYIVSHDLKAPLRQIEGFSDIILSKYIDDFDEKSKHHFNLIIKGTTQISSILDALVNYSRINTVIGSFEKLNTNDVVDKNIKELSSLIEETDAIITCEPLPNIIGDEAKLTQVFYQLIHNALHYQRPESQPNIVIQGADKKEYWEFSIRDNGIGITDNVKEKVFKVFRRGVSDKKYKGLGMGLSIAKKILAQHKGSIWVESNTDIGSSFHFTIAKDINNE